MDSDTMPCEEFRRVSLWLASLSPARVVVLKHLVQNGWQPRPPGHAGGPDQA